MSISTDQPVPTPDNASGALPTIEVAALAYIRDRRVLMVTARGRDVVYMPGGKIDAGETPVDAAVRESREEIAVELDRDSVAELFTVVTQAHGEPDGRLVRMRVFTATTPDEPSPSAEVSALHWATTADLHRCPPAGAEVLRLLAEADLID